MRARILTILFLTISTIAFCQDYKKQIESQFLEYNNLIINKDFDKSMSYMPDELFAIFPKEQMIVMMEKTFSNPDVEFTLQEPKLTEIGECEKIEDKFYSLLNYSNLMNMRFKKGDQEKETEEEHKQRIGLLKFGLGQNFGYENVVYNEETEFFEINAQKQAYAISKNGSTDWKFIVIDKEQRALLKRLLPKQLSDKI